MELSGTSHSELNLAKVACQDTGTEVSLYSVSYDLKQIT